MSDVPNSLETQSERQIDDAVRRDAFARVGLHDPARLNAVAAAVTRVQGFTLLSVRYAIAVLVLEALDGCSHDSKTGA